MYAGVAPGMGDGVMTSIMKVDMLAGENAGRVAEIKYPVGYVGGEMAFVARDKAAMEKGRTEEDDGYLMGFVTDKSTMTSYCMIYDAMSMSEEPVAKIEMPQRVPLGFHGLFVPQEDLNHQDVSAPPAAQTLPQLGSSLGSAAQACTYFVTSCHCLHSGCLWRGDSPEGKMLSYDVVCITAIERFPCTF
eukprot:TRINITY_DN25783_c0_g1_i1.p1 TRINITY_DN25783_c0_g1~~TRINITY_DN25783_c0_g1_i1.p1  ORF type:complete len:189 (+),score=28.27 TRINITY_DN25783_c0_g1_i1:94-660(+)